MPAPQPAAEHHSHHQGEQSALDEERKDVLGLGEVLGAGVRHRQGFEVQLAHPREEAVLDDPVVVRLHLGHGELMAVVPAGREPRVAESGG